MGTLCPEWAQRLGLPESVVIPAARLTAIWAQLAQAHSLTTGKSYRYFHLRHSDCRQTERGERAVKGICGQVDGSVVPGLSVWKQANRRLVISTPGSVATRLAAGTACRPASGTKRANHASQKQLLPALTEAWAKNPSRITCRWCSTGLTAAAHRTLTTPERGDYRS